MMRYDETIVPSDAPEPSKYLPPDDNLGDGPGVPAPDVPVSPGKPGDAQDNDVIDDIVKSVAPPKVRSGDDAADRPGD